MSDPYEFIAVSRALAHALYMLVCSVCVCAMYILFVRSKPTFESFCLPSSRHWKWPFLSSDRILLKNLSRRKLGVVNTFAIQGNYKRRSFYCFPSYPLLLLLTAAPSFSSTTIFTWVILDCSVSSVRWERFATRGWTWNLTYGFIV